MQMHIIQMIGGRNTKLCRPNAKRLIFTLKGERKGGHMECGPKGNQYLTSGEYYASALELFVDFLKEKQSFIKAKKKKKKRYHFGHMN